MLSHACCGQNVYLTWQTSGTCVEMYLICKIFHLLAVSFDMVTVFLMFICFMFVEKVVEVDDSESATNRLATLCVFSVEYRFNLCVI